MAARRSVLLAIDGLGAGGAERQMSLLAEGLKSRGVEVSVWALHGGPFEEYLSRAGIRAQAGPEWPGGSPSAAGLLRQALGSRPSVIHSWGWICAMVSWLAAPLSGAVHVTGLVRMGCAPPARRRRLLLAARLGRLAIGNSMAGLAAWRIPPRKARLVPNGFDPRRLEGLSRRSGRGRPFTVVMAGSMSAHKDFATLIRAVEELGRDRPDGFRLVLPGDGPDRGMLASMAAGLQGRAAVEMPGRLDEILPLLTEADAGVLLSPAGEGMSNAIMEYMASGLPVVCTSTGGNSELVRDGIDGFLVPPGDHQAVAARLSALASDPALSESMGMSGRSRIMTSFSAEEMVSRTLAVYDEALGRSL